MRILPNFIKTKFGQRIIAWVGATYIKFVYQTSVWTFYNKSIIDDYIKDNKPFIVCFWHHRLLMLPKGWQWDRPFKMLLSALEKLVNPTILYMRNTVHYVV